MGYSGYEEFLCASGHLRVFDAYDSPISQYGEDVAEKQYCSCGAKWAWWCGVDMTNGAYCQKHEGISEPEMEGNTCTLDCKATYPGEVGLEIDVPAVNQVCNLGHVHVVAEATFKIPKDQGHLLKP